MGVRSRYGRCLTVASNVVLVHGAWHGAWCWERVLPGLTEQGLTVTALDLPGHGEDREPLTDLHGDAARVTEALDRLDDPAVLVGHSYGGAVVTEAGDHPVVTSLVFIAAFALDAGESCVAAAIQESEAAGIDWEGRPNLGQGFIVAEDNTVTLDRQVAARCLYNDCDEEVTAWALDRLGPHPLGNLQQEPATIAWNSKPSTYVVCADDFGVHPDLQRVLAKRCATTVEWPTGHSPFLSDPRRVIGLLAEEAAARLGA
jgi:pimeloyl-ACP methyl ester carboxylesterase